LPALRQPLLPMFPPFSFRSRILFLVLRVSNQSSAPDLAPSGPGCPIKAFSPPPFSPDALSPLVLRNWIVSLFFRSQVVSLPPSSSPGPFGFAGRFPLVFCFFRFRRSTPRPRRSRFSALCVSCSPPFVLFLPVLFYLKFVRP